MLGTVSPVSQLETDWRVFCKLFLGKSVCSSRRFLWDPWWEQKAKQPAVTHYSITYICGKVVQLRRIKKKFNSNAILSSIMKFNLSKQFRNDLNRPSDSEGSHGNGTATPSMSAKYWATHKADGDWELRRKRFLICHLIFVHVYLFLTCYIQRKALFSKPDIPTRGNVLSCFSPKELLWYNIAILCCKFVNDINSESNISIDMLKYTVSPSEYTARY